MNLSCAQFARLGRGQVVRQRLLVPPCAGSNPAAPASLPSLSLVRPFGVDRTASIERRRSTARLSHDPPVRRHVRGESENSSPQGEPVEAEESLAIPICRNLRETNRVAHRPAQRTQRGTKSVREESFFKNQLCTNMNRDRESCRCDSFHRLQPI